MAAFFKKPHVATTMLNILLNIVFLRSIFKIASFIEVDR